MEYIKSLWARWKNTAEKIATFQTRVMLTVVYILLSPFGGIFQLLDPLRLRSTVLSRWNQVVHDDTTLPALQKQY